MSDTMTKTCTCLPVQGEDEPTIEPKRDPLTQRETFLGGVRRMMLEHQNDSDLRLLQDVILTEEGQTMNREEVLARVIGFYNRFVPFKQGRVKTWRMRGPRRGTASTASTGP